MLRFITVARWSDTISYSQQEMGRGQQGGRTGGVAAHNQSNKNAFSLEDS